MFLNLSYIMLSVKLQENDCQGGNPWYRQGCLVFSSVRARRRVGLDLWLSLRWCSVPMPSDVNKLFRHSNLLTGRDPSLSEKWLEQ